jgi:hypothetical protein
MAAPTRLSGRSSSSSSAFTFVPSPPCVLSDDAYLYSFTIRTSRTMRTRRTTRPARAPARVALPARAVCTPPPLIDCFASPSIQLIYVSKVRAGFERRQ